MSQDTVSPELGEIIRARLNEIGLDRKAYIAVMGLRPSFAASLLCRKGRGISYAVRDRLVKALGMDPKVLAPFVGWRRRNGGSGRFGEMLRARRKELGLTMDDVAREMSRTRAWVSSMELGKHAPDGDGVTRLAAFLRMDADALWDAYMQFEPPARK